ncbi:unnamed protein product [Bursaphelenchus xylophilus]|uniref:(pine wood nematode) hypothetical protein n=1 Tax=Bursaphelenchus xylophilus TaxID=6326 RepID=A0A1I7RR02_BURXY|nr:unnamed protein product [Bursaphelenchus xylophilus]CAG9130774.1 unnamed protein product [Bursaphelenchus xylophilus]
MLEGSSGKEAFHEYCRKFVTLFELDLCFWPPVQTVNFLIVPPKYRVIYVMIAMFFYNTVLTYVKHNL